LISFIFYPITFIASVFTIPGVHVPLIDLPYGWWIIMLLMVAMALGIWFFFKRNKWV
jgi:magnesium transporter